MAEGNGHDKAAWVHAGGASVVQVETLGRGGLILFIVVFLVITAIAFYVGRTGGIGEARAEDMGTQLRQMNARVSVLEYDAARIRAQLIEKGLINDTHE